MVSPTPLVQSHRRPNVCKSHGYHLKPYQPQEVPLMCSYGGRFVPRPHDKSLCYVGGESRIVVIHRRSSLRELSLRLSRTLLLHGRPFILKYLLPDEDFDSLISVIHDEDLQLMIQEYNDRVTSACPLKPLRLRLFLFFCEPENDTKQETRFEEPINDSRVLSRVVSDGSDVDCSAKPGGPPPNNGSGNNLEAMAVTHNKKQIKSSADVNTESDSLLVDTSSSDGSLSSSFSMSRVDDSGSGQKQEKSWVEELLANLSFDPTDTKKKDDGCAVSCAALAPPVMVTGHKMNGVTCDARTSDALSLNSPRSVVSESRIASSWVYSPKPVHLQDHAIQRDQVEECGCMLAPPPQVDQTHQTEQFVQFVQEAAIPSYCPVYAIPLIAPRPASTLHYNTASNPTALQQHYYLGFPQFHCLLHSNIAVAPAHVYRFC